jgi:hypothetical protein
MVRVLPPQPHPDHIRNEAKSVLKAHATGDPSVCATLRLLHRFKDAGDKDILAAEVALNEAQLALALDYGFKCWDDLKRHVQQVSGAPQEDEPRPGAIIAEGAPAGDCNVNRYARALTMTLSHAGAACDYHTVMGDSGLAFILQADAFVTPWGKPSKVVDIGWWPLDWWGALQQVEHVGRCVGLELSVIHGERGLFVKDPEMLYTATFQKPLTAALTRGVLPIAMASDCWVITCCDDGEPPLLGCRSTFNGHERKRVPEYPHAAIVPGKPCKMLVRGEADRMALEYAVALIREKVRPRFIGCLEQPATSTAGKTTGAGSYALWAKLLRDDEVWGAPFYHSNVFGNLVVNRRSAPPYVRAIAGRHPKVGVHLEEAACAFEAVIGKAETADTEDDTMAARQGREALARLVEEIAAIEAAAADAMECASRMIRG